MGLTLAVGTPEQVFVDASAARVREALTKELDFEFNDVGDGPKGGFFTDEVGWSGWGELQSRAMEALGAENARALTGVEAWQSVFLPLDLAPREVGVEGFKDPLQCASLFELAVELKTLSEAVRWPLGLTALRAEWAKMEADEERFETEKDLQTFIQLCLAIREAFNTGLPLWVVK